MAIPRPASKLPARFSPAVRIGTLQWAVGIFCVLTGALRWTAPIAATSFGLRSGFEWSGPALLLAGLGLLLVPVARPNRALAIAGHGIAGLAILAVASWYAAGGSRSGVVLYATVGLVTLASAPWAGSRGRKSPRTIDLFVLMVGLCLAGASIALLMTGDEVARFSLAGFRPYFGWYQVALMLASVALLATELLPTTPPWASTVARLVTAALMGVWFVVGSIPNHLWPGILFWGGFGGVLALLPWLGPRLAQIDPTSLHVRIALALAAAATFPLVVVVSLITARVEEVDIAQSLAAQQTLANVIAADVHDSLALHRAAMVMLAEQISADGGPTPGQQSLLRAFDDAFPDVLSIGAVHPSGNLIARSDPGALFPLPLDAAISSLPRVRVMSSPTVRQPIVVLDVPVLDTNRQLRGGVQAVLAPEALAATLLRADPTEGAKAYLVDADGRLLAHSLQAALFEDLSRSPPVAALLANARTTGAVRHRTADGTQFAAYARVPDLDWGVVVERPETAMLASTRAGQDAVFALLLLAIVVAAGLGSIVAAGIAAPLGSLAKAVDQLAAGDPSSPPSPLPRRGPAEVARLAGAFTDMRDRLDARTAERDLMEAQLLRAQRLETAGRLAGQVAHDFNNLLAPLVGYPELIKRQLPDDHPVIAYADAMAQAAQQLASINQDMLALGRRAHIARRPNDLNLLVEQGLDQLAPVPATLAVACHLAPDLLPVNAAESQILRVVLNLVTNAR